MSVTHIRANAGFELDDMYSSGLISEDDWKYQAVMLLLWMV